MQQPIGKICGSSELDPCGLYVQKANIQRYVNEELDRIIEAQEDSLQNACVLEIGAGVGIMTNLMAENCGFYIHSDVNETYVSYAAGQNSYGNFVVVDGEKHCFKAAFDVVISSMALHWFSDPKQGLHSLISCLKPGGRLYLTALGACSFPEWRTSHSIFDIPCGTPTFIPIGSLKSWLPSYGEREIKEEWLVQRVDDPIEFFHDLKRMGLGTPHVGHKPLPINLFKKVLANFATKKQLSYQILMTKYTKPITIAEE